MPHSILDLDYEGLGFKCGLEVHHQLLTSRKLFCRCPAGLYSDKVDAEVLRHMRPTMSELGEYDPCALMEFKKKKDILYILNRDSVCTYEMDDTPPFPVNQEAVDITLGVALLFDCQMVGEAHISRKQYLDGSIPTGFQRTAVVGVKGSIPYRGRTVRVLSVGFEEDSCREEADIRHTIQFRTDRLGIPLVEVVTQPDLFHPYEVAEIGKTISHTLRITGKVRRGIGSVRQDINVSIKGGTRVEIKGVPRIPLFPRLVSIEAYRQKRLLELRDIFIERGISASNLRYALFELPSEKIHFRTPKLAAAHAQGLRIAAVKFSGIAGLLSAEVQPGRTFANEVSSRVRVIACLDEMPNIFHTDGLGEFELYPEEQTAVNVMTGAAGGDVIVLIWGPDEDVTTGINEAITRIREVATGVPAETRRGLPGGCTDFERLLAGAERMYPDTDSPPTMITQERIERVRSDLPKPAWVRYERLLAAGVSPMLADQLVSSTFYDLFWKILSDGNLPANRIARILVQEVRALRRKRYQPEQISEQAWRKLFQHLRDGELHWESVPRLMYYRVRRPGADWLAIASRQGMLPLPEEEWMPMVDSVLHLVPRSENKVSRIRWFMGQMQRPAGRIPARRVAELLEQKLDDAQV